MNKKEKYIARILFKNNVLQKDGQAYEDFFVKVLQHYNPNFRPVKAHGQFGDRKNDGFDKTTGTYYQVYAPEDLEKRKKRLSRSLKRILMICINIGMIRSHQSKSSFMSLIINTGQFHK